jgi:hypothetical protein
VLLLISDDPGLHQFVIDHLFLVGGCAVTVFGMGCAVGRFLFDRAVLSLRAAAEGFERERDAAREERNEFKHQLEKLHQEIATLPDHQGEGAQEYVKGRKQAAGAQILGRFFSAIVAMMLLGAAVYNIYELRSLMANGATDKSLTEFREKSEGEFRELKDQLKQQTRPAIGVSKTKKRPTDVDASPIPQK